ncbi:MAG: putative baseplate assembly protein [Acidobacteriota bacterium]
MPLPVPQIDHRSQRELVREALARVPFHTPEWTNLNDSDPGVTLIQLFGFMTESLIYRANLIPERNRKKFLQLLGIELQAARAASTLVAFASPRGPLSPVPLAAEQEITAGKVAFRTEHALTVLPIVGRIYLKAPIPESQRSSVDTLYRRLYEDLAVAGSQLDYYETRPFETPAQGVTLPTLDLARDTVDGSLWLALLARPGDDPGEARRAIAHQILTIASMPALDEEAVRLPAGGKETEGAGGLTFQLPQLPAGEPAAGALRYRLLEARPSSDLLRFPGTVELRLPGEEELTYREELDPLEAGVGDLPPSLADSEDEARLVTWIRIRPPQTGDQLATRFSWLGINGALAAQRRWVQAEQLPSGTGEPDQETRLVHAPVLPKTLQLSVNGELWSAIDDLAAAPPEVPPRSPRFASPESPQGDPRVFTLEAASGTLRFGNGSHGARPPRGATLVARYAHGGGSQGMVGIGAIDKGPALPAGLVVHNPVPAWGGDDPETVDEAEFRISRSLRHRDRLVSREDFREITWQTPGVDLGRVEILPLFHPDQPESPADGALTVLVVPLTDRIQPETPAPDRLFLDAICRHLEPRRLITTEIHVRGPIYRDLWVTVGLEVAPGREQGPVLDRGEVAIRRFLSPLVGGFEGTGWPLEKTIEAGEVLGAVSRVDGVASILELTLGDGSGGAIERLELSGLELPRVIGVSVVAGPAVPLDVLTGERDDPEPPETPRVPVPVIPEEC